MKRTLLFLLAFLVFSPWLQSQYLTCEDALTNPICFDLDGFSSTLPDSNIVATPQTPCGITPHNAHFIPFVAGTSAITIELVVRRLSWCSELYSCRSSICGLF